MFSLRKRAKLLESSHSLNGLRSREKEFPLEKVPPELIMHIFDYLSVPELLHMRLVCKRFKILVDSYERFWQLISLEIRFDQAASKDELDIARKLLSLARPNQSIFINCSKNFRHKNSFVCSPNVNHQQVFKS